MLTKTLPRILIDKIVNYIRINSKEQATEIQQQDEQDEQRNRDTIYANIITIKWAESTIPHKDNHYSTQQCMILAQSQHSSNPIKQDEKPQEILEHDLTSDFDSEPLEQSDYASTQQHQQTQKKSTNHKTYRPKPKFSR